MGKHPLFPESIYFGSHINVLFCSQISSSGFIFKNIYILLLFFKHVVITNRSHNMLNENIREFKITLADCFDLN